MARTDQTRVERAFRSTTPGLMLLVVILVGFGFRYGIVNPGRNYQLDFRSIYMAGKALHLGLNPYDKQTLEDTIHQQVPGKQELVNYGYPPPTLPLAYVMAMLPLHAAQIVWALLQFALVVGGMLILFRALGIALGSAVSVLVATLFLLSDPLYNLFRWGQFDGTRLAFVCLAIFFLARRRTVLAGVSIGFGALAKMAPVAYLWIFLLRRDWRALLAGVATIVVLMAIGLAALTPEARRHYFATNKHVFEGPDLLISPINMSLHGYVYRAFVDNSDSQVEPSVPWVDLGPRFAWWATTVGILLLVGITSLWVVRCGRELATEEAVAAFVPVVLLSVPTSWPHHCVMMLVVLVFIIRMAGSQPRLALLDWGWVAAILLLHTFCPVHRYLVELPDWFEHLIGPTTTYSIVLAWLFMLVRYPQLKRRALSAADHRVRPAPAATAM